MQCKQTHGFFHIFQSWVSVQYRCVSIVPLFYKFLPAWASQHKFRQHFSRLLLCWSSELRTSSRLYFSAISISSAVGITVSSSKRLQNKFKYKCGHYLNIQLSKSLPFLDWLLLLAFRRNLLLCTKDSSGPLCVFPS